MSVPWMRPGQPKWTPPKRPSNSQHLTHEAPIVEPDFGPFDLHHAHASRYGAWLHLGLLEDHLIAAPCPNCMAKHCGRAIAYLQEARTLEDGDAGDMAIAKKLVEVLQAVSKGDESQLEVARALRLVLQERIGY